jgi:hypothetical protein
MRDDRSKSKNAEWIDLSRDHDVCFWCVHFEISASRLHELVGKVGRSVYAIADELRPERFARFGL